MYRLLEGLTVVEGAAFIAGPSCALHLAQLGARVIRFDQIGGGPDRARWPRSATGESYYWEGLNKGKQSIAIDLTHPDGRRLAQQLATAADGLFVTNFPAKGFLGYDTLAALRPDLICLRVMGWADGSNAVDYTINASVGLPFLTGHVDDPRPVNHVLPAWDLLAGTYGAMAMLAAERDRQRRGRGRELRLALSDVAAASLGHLGAVAETLVSGDRERTGNDLFGAFGRDFVSRDGVRLMIVAITARQWRALVSALDIGQQVAEVGAALETDFSVDEGARFVHRATLNALVADAVAAGATSELLPRFDAEGVCWSRYRSLSDALVNEPRLFGAESVFSEVTHPAGSYPTPGAPLRIPGDDRLPAAAAPQLGEHSDDVLAEMLGLSANEIGDLHDRGIVA